MFKFDVHPDGLKLVTDTFVQLKPGLSAFAGTFGAPCLTPAFSSVCIAPVPCSLVQLKPGAAVCSVNWWELNEGSLLKAE